MLGKRRKPLIQQGRKEKRLIRVHYFRIYAEFSTLGGNTMFVSVAKQKYILAIHWLGFKLNCSTVIAQNLFVSITISQLPICWDVCWFFSTFTNPFMFVLHVVTKLKYSYPINTLNIINTPALVWFQLQTTALTLTLTLCSWKVKVAVLKKKVFFVSSVCSDDCERHQAYFLSSFHMTRLECLQGQPWQLASTREDLLSEIWSCYQ